MSPWAVLAAGAAAAAVGLSPGALTARSLVARAGGADDRGRRPVRSAPPEDAAEADAGEGAGRPAWVVVALPVLAGAAVLVVLPGPVGWAGGAVAAALTLRGLRSASRRSRAAREAAVADGLPVLVDLLAGALGAGAPPARAVAVACAAWPGPAADRLATARSRLALGTDPVTVWEAVARDPALAPLGRTLARAASSGAPVAEVVARLGGDLADRARADAEDRARTVGVRAALPLGLCLLPAFVLLGIVPLAAGLLASLV